MFLWLTAGAVKMEFERTASNVIEAAGNGATEGMRLALNVAAMLIAIVALVVIVISGNMLVSAAAAMMLGAISDLRNSKIPGTS